MNNGNPTNNSLTTRAMLVTFSISVGFSASKKEKKIQQEVADTHNATEEWGRASKELFKTPEFDAFKKAVTAARTDHYELTLPWNDNGTRVLPSKAFMTYSEKIREHKPKILAALEKFADVVESEDFHQKEKSRLGNLHNRKDYPTRDQILKKLATTFTTDFIPLPDTGDFRVSLADDEIAQIKSSAETYIKESMRDLWTRLYEKVIKMQETLSDPKAIFRDSLVKNLQDLTELLPTLNYAGDEDLTRMTEEVKNNLTNYSPNDLRESSRARQETADKAKEIADQMRAFMDTEI